MRPMDQQALNLISPYYKAVTHLPAGDKAFEEGKQRYIRTLQKKIEDAERLTVDDYNAAFGIQLEKSR